MVNKNIQMKKKNNNEWINLFPTTLFENVFTNDGKRLDNIIEELETVTNKDINDLRTKTEQEIENVLNESKQYTDDKISNIRMIAEYDVDPTGERDSLQGFIDAFNDLGDHETLLLQANATYLLSESLILEKAGGVSIDGNGATFRTNTQNEQETGITLKGKVKTNTIMNSIDGNVVTVASTADIEMGDLLYFQSSEQFNNQRQYYKKGGVFVVSTVLNSTQFVMSSTFPYEITQSIITVYDPITVDIRNLNIINNFDPSKYTMGLDIKHAVDSNLQNIYSSGFDICIHIREHYQTTVSQVSTGKSYFEGTSQAYGLASYISNNLMILNSRFVSGRHGLEITGFENSFNTLVMNTDVGNEAGTSLNTSAFNQHQSSHGLIAINCQFESVGLAGISSLLNCKIYGEFNTRLSVSNNLNETSFIFDNCIFPNNHVITASQGGTGSSGDGQSIEPLPNKIGKIIIRDSVTNGRLRIVTSSVNNLEVDKIKIENSNMVVLTDVYNGTSINHLVFEDCEFNLPEVLLSQRTDGESYINKIYFLRCKLRIGYNAININNFSNIIFEHCVQDNPTENPIRWTFDSSFGKVLILYSNFNKMEINVPNNLREVILFYSSVQFRDNHVNITLKKEAQMNNINI